MMRDDLVIRCLLCGAPLSMPWNGDVRFHIEGACGHDNERVVIVDGREIHRCAAITHEDPNLVHYPGS